MAGRQWATIEFYIILRKNEQLHVEVASRYLKDNPEDLLVDYEYTYNIDYRRYQLVLVNVDHLKEFMKLLRDIEE